MKALSQDRRRELYTALPATDSVRQYIAEEGIPERRELEEARAGVLFFDEGDPSEARKDPKVSANK